jgi:hypothetical protein
MDSPLPKREYNAPPPQKLELSFKLDDKVFLQRELQRIRRELLTLARRIEQLTTGQETA